MKKVILKQVQPVRRLVAVVGANGDGLWLPKPGSEKGTIRYYGATALETSSRTLEELLVVESRSAVYEGDIVEIQF